MSSGRRAVLVYMEPTPYVLGLVEEIRRISALPIEVWLLKEDFSQNWGLPVPDNAQLLKSSTISVVRKIVREINRRNTALVHLCGWGGDPALLALVAVARSRGIPVFVESDTQMSPDESRFKKFLKRLMYPMLFRLPFKFLPGGTRQAAYLREFGVPESKICVVNMTVDVTTIEAFKAGFDSTRRRSWRAAARLEADAIVFLFVGRLEPHKGIACLLEQFGRLADISPEARLVLVGDGTMRKFVSERMQVYSWLRCPGRLQGDELFAAYCSSDVFVLPSSFEPWGLVVNEAMAAGLAVIVSDRVGCGTDLVESRGTGRTYAVSDPEQLFQAMQLMVTDADGRQRMGRNASRLIAGWTLQAEAERICAEWRVTP